MKIMLPLALKQIRKFHSFKQVELAEKLGISKSYLSEIEGGTKTISLELLDKYSKIFSIPVSSLLIFSENINAPKKSDRFRLKIARKIIKIMEWMNDKNEHKKH